MEWTCLDCPSWAIFWFTVTVMFVGAAGAFGIFRTLKARSRMDQSEPIVMEGTWLYAGAVPSGVRIRAAPIRFGSGDYEDPAELRDDVELAGFAVEYEHAGGGGWSGHSGTAYLTLDQAIASVEEQTGGSIKWKPSQSGELK